MDVKCVICDLLPLFDCKEYLSKLFAKAHTRAQINTKSDSKKVKNNKKTNCLSTSLKHMISNLPYLFYLINPLRYLLSGYYRGRSIHFSKRSETYLQGVVHSDHLLSTCRQTADHLPARGCPLHQVYLPPLYTHFDFIVERIIPSGPLANSLYLILLMSPLLLDSAFLLLFQFNFQLFKIFLNQLTITSFFTFEAIKDTFIEKLRI